VKTIWPNTLIRLAHANYLVGCVDIAFHSHSNTQTRTFYLSWSCYSSFLDKGVLSNK